MKDAPNVCALKVMSPKNIKILLKINLNRNSGYGVVQKIYI